MANDTRTEQQVVHDVSKGLARVQERHLDLTRSVFREPYSAHSGRAQDFPGDLLAAR